MDQENYNDIDMEIEMDSNDIDVSAEMPNEIVVDNYNSLKNKPSINSVELVGNKTLEDLGITEYVEGEIANFDFIKIVPQLPEKGLINRTYFVPKTDPESNDLYEEYMWINNKWEMMGTKQIKVDLTDYVKNTDYAKADKGGTIKTGNGVSLKNGVIQTDSIDYNAYKDSPNEHFIGKGTLEKVIEGKELINKEYSDNIVKEQRLENERLRNDIKSIALPGEASGENIHLEDSSDARCEIKICGNHQQETREGYNQFKIISTSTQSAGITITKVDESSVSYQGTTTGLFTHILVEYDGNGLEITKQMYLKAFGNLTNAILSVKLIKNGKTESSYLRVSPDLILSAGDVLQQIYVQQQNTGILVSGTLQVLLTDYENKDKPYEQYGASPSFAYPSSVKAVGDVKNILNMTNAKGGTSNGITCNMIADGSYTYKGTASSKAINIWLLGSYNNKTSIFRLEPGTYYIDGVVLFNGNNVLANPDTAKIFTFINAHDITGVRVPDAVPGNTYDETKYPIIAKIDHEIPWIPYEMGYIKVNEFNKNYLSKIPKKSITAQGVTSTFDGEKFICKGTAQANYFNLLTGNVYKKIGKGIKTLSTNKLKKGRVFIHLDYVDGTSQNYYTSINTNRASFTLNKDVESYRLNVDSITAGDTIDDNIYVQLEDGNIATEIEKAENQEYLVDVQQEMLEGDTFVRQDGKWYEMHNWIKIIVDGTNVKVTDTKDTGYVIQALLRTKNCKPGIGYSNRFIYDKVLTWKTPNTLIFTTIGVYLHFDRSLLGDLTINNENINAMLKKQYDSGNEIYVLGQLLEPQLLECTEAQSKVLDEIYNKAHTYKNITNISAESAEVNPIVSLKYLKDTEKYIEDKITNALTKINAVNQVRTQMLDAEVEI